MPGKFSNIWIPSALSFEWLLFQDFVRRQITTFETFYVESSLGCSRTLKRTVFCLSQIHGMYPHKAGPVYYGVNIN